MLCCCGDVNMLATDAVNTISGDKIFQNSLHEHSIWRGDGNLQYTWSTDSQLQQVLLFVAVC